MHQHSYHIKHLSDQLTVTAWTGAGQTHGAELPRRQFLIKLCNSGSLPQALESHVRDIRKRQEAEWEERQK